MTIQKDDLDGVRAFIEKDRAENGNKGGPWFSIKEDGEREVRILKLPEFKTGTHWNVIEGKNGGNASIRCPRVILNEACPICEYVEELGQSEKPEDQDAAKKMSVQEKYPIVLLDMEEDDPKPRIYEAPKSVFYKIWDLIASKSGSYKDLLSFERGRNIILERDSKKKSSKYVEYNVIPAPDRSAVQVDKEEMESLFDILKPASYEDIEHALNHGVFPEREESESKKSKPFGGASYKKGLPKTKTRDEEPVEAAEDDLGEEVMEDIPPPAPKPTQPAERRTALSPALRSKVASMSKRG